MSIKESDVYMATIQKDIYILGQSQQKQIQSIGEEIRLDLQLQPQPLNTSGTVTGTVTSGGNPVQNALIKLMDNNYNPLLHAVTGTDGSYTMENVLAGTGYKIFCIASGMELSEGTSFNIQAGQVITSDFTLTEDPNASLAIIAGDLVDSSTGAAINGAVVSLYIQNPDTTLVLEALTYTNQYGQFTFRELDLGNYIIRVSALGYNSTASTIQITAQGQIGQALITMIANQQSSRGTVSGMITDAKNQPIVNADVILYSVDTTTGDLTAISFGTTNSSGVYLFINVPQGNYLVKSNQSQSVVTI